MLHPKQPTQREELSSRSSNELVEQAGQSKTIIAFMGTAIIAKCTDININNVFSLKVGDGMDKTKYNARR